MCYTLLHAVTGALLIRYLCVTMALHGCYNVTFFSRMFAFPFTLFFHFLYNPVIFDTLSLLGFLLSFNHAGLRGGEG